MVTLDIESRALCLRAKELLSHHLFDGAIPILKQIVDTAASPLTMSWLIAALIAAGRTDEALKCATDSSESYPNAWEAQAAMGRALAALRDYKSAVQAFQASAVLRRGLVRGPVPSCLGLHSLEQLDYLGRNVGIYPEFYYFRSQTPRDEIETLPPDANAGTYASATSQCEAEASRALSLPLFIPTQIGIEKPLNEAVDFGRISAEFMQDDSSFVIIDDFLSLEALESLRHFCLGATVWRRSYERGYVGAFPEDGFASVLLFEIADALRHAMPGPLGGHRLAQWWALAYDQRLSGTDVHADDSEISVNFWITRTEANLQRGRGGLVMWDRTVPDDWKFEDYNGNNEKVRLWLAEMGATETVIPHRANRAVMFRGHFFHRSDGTNFAPGYENRRRNITFLFHRQC